MTNQTLRRSWIPGVRGRAGAAVLAMAVMLAAVVLATGSAQAQTYTTFNATGAGTGENQGTVATSINTAGTIAGFYIDGSNVNHGFVRATNGTITGFEAPGAGTEAKQGTTPLILRERSRGLTTTQVAYGTASCAPTPAPSLNLAPQVQAPSRARGLTPSASTLRASFQGYILTRSG